MKQLLNTVVITKRQGRHLFGQISLVKRGQKKPMSMTQAAEHLKMSPKKLLNHMRGEYPDESKWRKGKGQSYHFNFDIPFLSSLESYEPQKNTRIKKDKKG